MNYYAAGAEQPLQDAVGNAVASFTGYRVRNAADPEPEPTPEPTPEATPEPTPELKKEPVPEPEPEPANRAPVVDEGAEHYGQFVGSSNAPRGILVYKFFDGVFSDPDGDELSYAAEVRGEWASLVSILHVSAGQGLLFVEVDGDADWAGLDPVPPDPVSVEVVLTATDPDGLSASVSGTFATRWDAPVPEPEPADDGVCGRTSQVADALAEVLRKACEEITDDDLATVTSLDLSGSGLGGLAPGDLDGMPSLTKLDLSDNPRLYTPPPAVPSNSLAPDQGLVFPPAGTAGPTRWRSTTSRWPARACRARWGRTRSARCRICCISASTTTRV